MATLFPVACCSGLFLLQHISTRCSFCSEVILPVLALCPAALIKNSYNSTLKEEGSGLQLVSHGRQGIKAAGA